MGFQLHNIKLIPLQDFLNIQDHFYWVTGKKKRRDFDLHAFLQSIETAGFSDEEMVNECKMARNNMVKRSCNLTDVDSG